MVNPYTLHSHCQTLHVCLNTRVFLTIDEARLWKGDLKTSHKQCRPIKLRVNAYFYIFPMICCGHLMLQSKCLKERGHPLAPSWHFGCTSCNFKRKGAFTAKEFGAFSNSPPSISCHLGSPHAVIWEGLSHSKIGGKSKMFLSRTEGYR